MDRLPLGLYYSDESISYPWRRKYSETSWDIYNSFRQATSDDTPDDGLRPYDFERDPRSSRSNLLIPEEML